jgi:putative transport protein
VVLPGDAVIELLFVALRQHPELAVFLTLAIGFLIGRLRLGAFRLGNVVGTLLAGVLVGQIGGIVVDPMVRIVFFDLFLFATGYKVGPQFFRGLGRQAMAQALLTVVLCGTSLATALLAARVMDYDVGTAAGLMAGAFTESTVIGTAGDAIRRLPLPESEKADLLNRIPVAYAVSYLMGTTAVVWLLSSLAPRLLRVDLRKEARDLEAGFRGTDTAPGVSAFEEWDRRAFLIREGTLAGRTVREIEKGFEAQRLFVERLRRDGEIRSVGPDLQVRDGDVVAVAGRRSVLVAGAAMLGTEVADAALLAHPLVTADVVVTKFTDRGLGEIARQYGHGVLLQSLVRGGQDIPFHEDTTLYRGDLLRIAGNAFDVARASEAIGYVERPSSETDVVFVGLGVLIGGLFGLLSIDVAGLPLTLTSSGGALIMGLVFGWLRSVRPTFGRIPEPALWVFDTIGLAVFIGVVGLDAGPTFVAGLKQTGPALLGVALVVCVTPHVVALLFGRYVLGMHPVILLGACAGAGTATAALRAVQDEAQSRLPVLGYTVPYAIGNILLTAWGPVIVALMA